MPSQEISQVCIAIGVPIDAQDDIAMNFGQAMTQSTCRSKGLRFMGIGDRDGAEATAKIILDLLAKVSGAKYDLFGAMQYEPIEQVVQKGLSID
jgi:hypothetical protein